jgi:hypothetical protein
LQTCLFVTNCCSSTKDDNSVSDQGSDSIVTTLSEDLFTGAVSGTVVDTGNDTIHDDATDAGLSDDGTTTDSGSSTTTLSDNLFTGSHNDSSSGSWSFTTTDSGSDSRGAFTATTTTSQTTTTSDSGNDITGSDSPTTTILTQTTTTKQGGDGNDSYSQTISDSSSVTTQVVSDAFTGSDTTTVSGSDTTTTSETGQYLADGTSYTLSDSHSVTESSQDISDWYSGSDSLSTTTTTNDIIQQTASDSRGSSSLNSFTTCFLPGKFSLKMLIVLATGKQLFTFAFFGDLRGVGHVTPEPFLKPRLIGSRFEGGVIPLELLADFAVLEEMIVEVAKWKFREANPDRKRVPRGFSDGITLKLTGIEDGSAIPIIKLVVAASMLFPPSSQTYFEDARTAIIGAIGAAGKGTPITDYLPQKLLGYVDRFDRNLNEGEAIELSDGPGGAPVRLTKETRRKLLFASSAEEFTEETSIHGLVHEFDQRVKTFQLMLLNGTILSRIPVESQHYDTVLEASNGFRDKLRVRVYGVGRFDRNNRLQQIEKVEHMAILDPLDIGARLDEFKLLKAGWLGGQGVPPAHEGLDWLSEAFDLHYYPGT